MGYDRALRNEILPRFELRVWMLNLIKNLRKSSIRSAILSDQTNWLDELEAQNNFFKWFDRVFNSYHLGKSKKDPTLFDDVVDEMDTIPERALFVDDDRGNIARAGQKGLHTIHYQSRQTFERDLFSFFPFLKTIP
ncbi:MAG: HAD-IA family hydrolase [Deltaproteobacteria bacterium]|nr:HAD-IA family hydrolase [Deltaproteobacteria bacterium]